jgi:hypothetical protein
LLNLILKKIMDNTNRNTQNSGSQNQNSENDRNRQSGLGSQGQDNMGTQQGQGSQTQRQEGYQQGGGSNQSGQGTDQTDTRRENETIRGEDDMDSNGTNRESSQKRVTGDESQQNVSR